MSCLNLPSLPRRRYPAHHVSSPDRARMWGILADVFGRLLPEQQQTVHLSFSLADPAMLDSLMAMPDFKRFGSNDTRGRTALSFDQCWEPIEAGIGSIPQTYLMLPDAARRNVRQEVRAKLAEFESGGRLRMNLEMLIASGRA